MSNVARYESDTEAINEFMPVLATTTEVCSLDTILRELGQRLRDLLRKDLIAKTRGVQGVQHSSSKVVEEGVEQTTHRAESAVHENLQIQDQQGEAQQPTGELGSSVGGGRGSLKYIIYFFAKIYNILIQVLTLLLVCHTYT